MKKNVQLLFASTFLMTSVTANAGIIASDSFDGSKYTVYENSGISWLDAQAIAHAAGGYLVTLTNSAEDTFVASLVNGTGLGEVWAGGFQDASGDPDQNWNWVTGESWHYTNWNPGEPNDHYGTDSEQYLGINWTGDTWNDEGALGNIKGFVVEAAVPEPSIVALFALGLLGLGIARRKMRT